MDAPLLHLARGGDEGGQLAFGCRLGLPSDPAGEPGGLIVLTLSTDGVSRITRFVDPTLTARFEE